MDGSCGESGTGRGALLFLLAGVLECLPGDTGFEREGGELPDRQATPTAKREEQSDFAERLFRGGSSRPLFITAAGIAPDIAAGYLRKMAGAHRIPTLLKRVDRLCRQGPSSITA
jgi:hypothetical protein